MTKELANILPTDFAPTSKVWIYQSSRPFSKQEEQEINEQLYNFYITSLRILKISRLKSSFRLIKYILINYII